MAAAQFLTIFAGLIGVLALGVYLFGIPPELKRKLERSALKTMGENKLSYMAKGMQTPPYLMDLRSWANTTSVQPTNHP